MADQERVTDSTKLKAYVSAASIEHAVVGHQISGKRLQELIINMLNPAVSLGEFCQTYKICPKCHCHVSDCEVSHVETYSDDEGYLHKRFEPLTIDKKSWVWTRLKYIKNEGLRITTLRI